MSPSPFVVGQWVRGESFYGRDAELAETMEDMSDAVWVLGSRRIGKTSFLRQLEHLARQRPGLPYLPLFWNLEGATDLADLHQEVREALLDAEEDLAELGIGIDDVLDDDLFHCLRRLTRQVARLDRRLLLLIDEPEVLLEVSQREAGLLPKLRKLIHGGSHLRTVMASTVRLWELRHQRSATSPFLHGFGPPVYLAGLERVAAVECVLQTRRARDRPDWSAELAEEVADVCAGHPYLLQLLAKRLSQLGDLSKAIEAVDSEPMVQYLFTVDFDLLAESERELLVELSRGGRPLSEQEEERLTHDPRGGAGEGFGAGPRRLEALGLLRRLEDGTLAVSHRFLRDFLRQRGGPAAPSPTDSSTERRLWDKARETFGEALRREPSQVDDFLATECGDDPDLHRLVSSLLQHHASADDFLEPTAVVERPPMPASAPSGTILGRSLSRYEIVERLGGGGMGEVFLARDLHLQRTVALKFLAPTPAPDELARTRLLREAMAASRLGHPGLCAIHDLGETADGRMFLVIPYYEGRDLNKVLEGGPLPAGRALTIAARIAEALDAAHRAGIVHRDIKPSNIILRSEDRPVIVDFGLALMAEESRITQADASLGTPAYMSPEQIRGRVAAPTSDLWSLGVLLYQMLSGDLPFSGPGRYAILYQVLHDDPTPLRLPGGQPAPPGLDEALGRLLAKRPEDRFQDAGELPELLRALAATAPGS